MKAICPRCHRQMKNCGIITDQLGADPPTRYELHMCVVCDESVQIELGDEEEPSLQPRQTDAADLAE